MKIIIAPDSFKGSLSAQALCSHMRKAIHRVLPQAEIIEIPIADGGEGTLDSVLAITGGSIRELTVADPLGRPVSARYGVLSDNVTALIEMAQASGLTHVSADTRNPLIATSFGTGELILDALNQGYRRFVIGIGGSATNDAGVGMLRALNVKFLDLQGRELPDGGSVLSQLRTIDASQLDPRILESEIEVICDVTNTLCGPKGASIVFGPQKGADSERVQILDQALNHYADIVLQQKGIELRDIVGGGAAGGMGSALVGFLYAKPRSGIEWILQEARMEEHLQGADFLFTGEGRLDSQTMSGKVISGIGKLAAKHHVPVVALCGSVNVSAADLTELGVTAAFSIVNGPCTLEEAIAKTPEWIELRVESICRLLNSMK